MRSFFTFLFVVLLANSAMAAGPAFENLTEDDFQGVIRDFSSVFAHTSVSPASSLGQVFGFEIGAVAGAAQTPKIESLANDADPGSDVSMLPNAAALAVFSFPLGLTAEALILPTTTISDISVGNTSLAVKWTFTDVFPLPVDMAAKLSVTKSEMSFTGNVSGTDTDFDYESSMTGLLIQASKKLTIFEPYLGVGMIKSKGKMKYTGTAQVFDTTYTSGQSAEEEITGMQLMAGANFNVLVLKLGFEVSRVFDATKAAVKLSFYF